MNIVVRAFVFLIAVVAGPCRADDADRLPSYFTKLYTNLCLQNLDNLESLRSSLTANNFTKLPPNKAALFLAGDSGDAWSLPFDGQMGDFVVALFSEKKVCAVYARRANPSEVRNQFIRLLSAAPPPLISELLGDQVTDTGANGRVHTISYAWSSPQAQRKMLFSLTTSQSENVQLKAVATATIVANNR